MNDQLVTPGGNPAEGKCRRPLMGNPTKDGSFSIRFPHRTDPYPTALTILPSAAPPGSEPCWSLQDPTQEEKDK